LSGNSTSFEWHRHSRLWWVLPAASVVLAAGAPLAADIIDRIAVSVGNRVITTSDLDREIRVTAFLNGSKPDLSPANKRATAQRMVEQTLIRRELEVSRYPVPTAAEVEPVLETFRRQNFKSDAEFRKALADAGITEQDVKDELLWQRALLLFIDVRFRPGVQISEQEIQNYFNNVVALTAQPGQRLSLEDYRASIVEKLAGQRVDQELDTWLKEARRRTEIVFHEEAFQ